MGRVRLGQNAIVSADAFGQEVYGGRVIRVGAMMGRKRVRSGDPAEKSDRDVLEVIVDLGKIDSSLQVGLRVTVKFLQ